MIIVINESSVKEQHWNTSKRLVQVSASIRHHYLERKVTAVQGVRGVTAGILPFLMGRCPQSSLWMMFELSRGPFWQGSVLSFLNLPLCEIHSKDNFEAYQELAEGQFKFNSRTLDLPVTVLQVFACIFGKQSQDLSLLLHPWINVKPIKGAIHPLMRFHLWGTIHALVLLR